MRVISGTARGLKLTALSGDDTRPTLDNVKEAVFSMLFDKAEGAKVLDLFSGSGALGIEALSRGAQRCVFSDKNEKAVKVIRDNLSKSHLSDKAEVFCQSFERTLEILSGKGEKFDIIFLDPPYDSTLLNDSIEKILAFSLLADSGIIVAESDRPDAVSNENLTVLKDKKYGRVFVKFLEAK